MSGDVSLYIFISGLATHHSDVLDPAVVGSAQYGTTHVRQLVHGNTRMVWCLFDWNLASWILEYPPHFLCLHCMSHGDTPKPFNRWGPGSPNAGTANGMKHVYSGSLLECVLVQVCPF